MKITLEDSEHKVEIEMTGGSEDLATATELTQVASNAMGRLRLSKVKDDKAPFGFSLGSETALAASPEEGQQ